MQNIFSSKSNFFKTLEGKSLILMFDYDGTIVPITSRPELARMPTHTTSLLRRLSKRKGVKISIITGRSMRDIKRLFTLSGTVISANHGFEISLGRHLIHPCGTKIRYPMASLAKELQHSLKPFPDVILESKGFSVAIHFRLLPQRLWNDVERTVRRISLPWRKRYDWRMTAGKRIWEIRPSHQWNKGKVALWLWKNLTPDALPVFFGDDRTDEDAFKTLAKSGVTISVGKITGSRAQYFVHNVKEVLKTLQLLEDRLKKTVG